VTNCLKHKMQTAFLHSVRDPGTELRFSAVQTDRRRPALRHPVLDSVSRLTAVGYVLNSDFRQNDVRDLRAL
jgi:hypothetical protein